VLTDNSSNKLGRMARISIRRYHFSFQEPFLSNMNSITSNTNQEALKWYSKNYVLMMYCNDFKSKASFNYNP